MLSGRDAVVAFIGAVSTVAVAWVLREDPLEAAVAAVIAAASTWLAIIDFNEHRLPDRIVGPLAGFATVAVVVLGLVDDDIAQAGTAIAVAVAVVAGLFVLNLAVGVGMGDVKFSYPLAVMLVWLGNDALRIGALAMILSAGVYTAARLIRARSSKMQIPFGPFMALGFVVAILTTMT